MASKASAVEDTDPAKTVKESRIIVGDQVIEDGTYSSLNTVSMGDPDKYSAQTGVLTFRGGPLRDNGAYGTAQVEKEELVVKRAIRTTVLDKDHVGFGVGSQPIIVKWYKNIREMMNIVDESKTATAMKEVIVPSNDGRIYFVDLDKMTYSRDSIFVGYPMKSAASVNPYGYPLLYVGQSEDDISGYKGLMGMRIYNLIDQSMAKILPGTTYGAYSEEGSVTTSALVESASDTLIYAGNNGTLNTVSMNTDFDLENGTLTINPQRNAYAFKSKLKNGEKNYGISSSPAAYGDYVFFGDKAGSIQCVNMSTLQPVWTVDMEDSVVCSVALEIGENGEVYLYAGNVTNKRAKSAPVKMVKLNALTGEKIWEVKTTVNAKYASAPAKEGIYGGVTASPLIGEGDISDLVIFNVNNLVDGKTNYAVVYALDKLTGEEIWSQPLDVSSVSSPIAMYRPDGKSYIVMGDDNGTLRLMDGFTGSTIHTVNLGSTIQASPAAYGNRIVVGTTGGMLYFVDLE